MEQNNTGGQIANRDIENSGSITFLQELTKRLLDPNISEEMRSRIREERDREEIREERDREEQRIREERDHEFRMTYLGALRYLIFGSGQTTATVISMKF
jgi:hypothetical protein